MKIIAVFAALLGAAGPLSAAPEDHEPTGRIRHTVGEPRPSRDDAWIELASPTPASNGREFIEIDASYGPFVRLRLDATAGRPTVRSVRVEYTDGTHRVIDIGKVLDRQHPVYVELQGSKRIERVIVVTWGTKQATYSVRGAPARGGFAFR